MITCYQEIIDIMVLLLVTHRYIASFVRHSMALEKIVWFDLIVVEKQSVSILYTLDQVVG